EVPMPRSGKWANAGVVRGNGREVAWRGLDSQHFGVAQRRRRVFVVADFGGHGAAEILFEREGVPGHPPQGRAPAEGITGALTGGASSSSAGNPDDNRAQAGFLVPVKNDTAPTVLASWGHNGYSSPRGDGTAYAVRRLTPRECERLQAFPDDHTRYDHHGREIADTHRYRMLGNAVTVTVANWIAHRIRQAA